MSALTPEVLAMLRQRAEQDQVLFNPKEISALLDRVEALEDLAKPLLEAGLESNEPYWPESEDDSHECEWWPVPGMARRALWSLRQK